MRVLATLVILATAALQPVYGDVKPGSLFTDHMVLQQGMDIPIWGWAEVGEKITVTFAGQKKTTHPYTDGTWFLTLDPIKATTRFATPSTWPTWWHEL